MTTTLNRKLEAARLIPAPDPFFAQAGSEPSWLNLRHRMTCPMSLRDELPRIIASDPRYAIDAYAFVLEALHHARSQKLKAYDRASDQARASHPARKAGRSTSKSRRPSEAGHVTGRELCEAVRKLALRQYGFLAMTVLGHWGIRSTSDIGDIVYNMIAAGDLEKTPSDSRSDFDNVFEFETALRPKLHLARPDVA
jgi:uncharacterized repeat protein (TIGR04138 family)